MKPNPTHGGSRPNSGRKPKPYKTKVLSFRVRVEHVAEVKAVVKDKIEELKKIVKLNQSK